MIKYSKTFHASGKDCERNFLFLKQQILTSSSKLICFGHPNCQRHWCLIGDKIEQDKVNNELPPTSSKSRMKQIYYPHEQTNKPSSGSAKLNLNNFLFPRKGYSLSSNHPHPEEISFPFPHVECQTHFTWMTSSLKTLSMFLDFFFYFSCCFQSRFFFSIFQATLTKGTFCLQIFLESSNNTKSSNMNSCCNHNRSRTRFSRKGLQQIFHQLLLYPPEFSVSILFILLSARS